MYIEIIEKTQEQTYLLLKGSWHQPSQFHETVVDAVSSPLLNDLYNTAEKPVVKLKFKKLQYRETTYPTPFLS